jgi:hypothetical protein
MPDTVSFTKTAIAHATTEPLRAFDRMRHGPDLPIMRSTMTLRCR